MKVICKIIGHKWNGCMCERCEEKRDQEHRFALCSGQCTRCGKMGPREHDWDGCTCAQCGYTRNKEHRYAIIPLEDEEAGFAGFSSPVREKCTLCKHVRFIEYKGPWAKNPLKALLEWPGSFLYSGQTEPDTKHCHGYTRVNFPFDGDARECHAAVNARSPEPEIASDDFTMLIFGSQDNLAEQVHSLFTYFAHTHNPKVWDSHLGALSKAYGLNFRLLQQCHTVLTSNEKWESDLRNGTRWGKILKKEEVLQCLNELPTGIGNNLLHLLAVKRNVAYTMEYMADDYVTKITGQYASVKFGEIPEQAAIMLKERGEPAYSSAHYNEFPR